MAAASPDIKFLSFPPGAKEPLFCVDGFQFSNAAVTEHYFLSHFHGDHTVGLRSSFDDGVIYCSPITARLVRSFTGVDPRRVIDLPLGKPTEIAGVRVTLIDANHCPGAVVFIFHHLVSGHTIVHTGDVRAAQPVQEAVQQALQAQSLSVVHELFLDTTYALPRWDFPPQPEVLEVLANLCAEEAKANPRTLFIVGSYQIGKERAAAAIARAVSSSVWTSSRRYQMLEACEWTSEKVNGQGQLLFTTDSVGCNVRMDSMMGISHERLLSTLEHTKGGFDAVCAFRPTGWTFSKTWRKCRPWLDNDGRTKIISMPYSEHSSFSELRDFVSVVRPQKIVPTVNIERSQQMVDMFAPGMDLSCDRERLDWYLKGWQAKNVDNMEPSYVNVLKISEGDTVASRALPEGGGSSSSSSSSCSLYNPTSSKPSRRISMESCASSRCWAGQNEDDINASYLNLIEVSDGEEVSQDNDAARSAGRWSSEIRGTDRLDDLSCVDLAAQRRQLEHYAKLARAKSAAEAQKAQTALGKKVWHGAQQQRKNQMKPAAASAEKSNETNSPKKRAAPAERKRGEAKKRQRVQPLEEEGGVAGNGIAQDGSAVSERRAARFIPKPSQQVRERMDRAFEHRMYLLRATTEPGPEGRPGCAKLDVLGSTGNVYTVTIGKPRQACTCTDFGKQPNRVCKHILFVMLRVCKLATNDPRVWQAALTTAEVEPLLSALPTRREELSSHGDCEVLANAEVLRGFDMARGALHHQEAVQRPFEDNPDCPICFEPLVAGNEASSKSSVDWCRSCGHNAHRECVQKWHAARGGSCPLCRGMWSGSAAAPAQDAPLNLAAFTGHAAPSLQELYPETHQWIGSPGRRRTSAGSAGERTPPASSPGGRGRQRASGRGGGGAGSSPYSISTETPGSARRRTSGADHLDDRHDENVLGSHQALSPQPQQAMQQQPQQPMPQQPQQAPQTQRAQSPLAAQAQQLLWRQQEKEGDPDLQTEQPQEESHRLLDQQQEETAQAIQHTSCRSAGFETPITPKLWPSGFCRRGSVMDTRSAFQAPVVDLA